MLLPVRLSSITLVAVFNRYKFSAIFLHCLVPWPSADIHLKFYGNRPRGTPPLGRLNTRAEYSDFGPVEGYISETVQDRRQVSINH